MSRVRAASLILLFALATLPSDARADWIVVPYAGIASRTHVTFTDIAGPFENRFGIRPTFGAALTWSNGGLFEVEADVGLSPDLLGARIADDDFEYGDNRLISMMGNLKAKLPWTPGWLGGLRPYAVAGLGVFHTRITDPDGAFDVAGNQLGFDVGGGVSAAIGTRLRLQADARYFRTLQGRQPADELDLAIDALSFWRMVVGIGYRF
jgi:opacity protein-like surface antigen